jgi:predicted RNase H-like nuclease (RuvC/YqgF family)
MKLTEIRLDGLTQSRVDISTKTIDLYVEKMTAGEVFPPLQVYYDGENHWLVDGFHRYEAYKKCGLEDVEVTVVNGTLKEAIECSFTVNDKHGLPATREDKRKNVTLCLTDKRWEGLSDREIAKITGTSHPFVAKIRKELSTPAEPKKPIEQPKPEIIEIEEEDEVKELISQTESLAKELEQAKTKIAILEMDDLSESQQEVADTIESLQKRVRDLELEVEGLKKSRDSYMTENAELKKSVTYWKRQADQKL